MKVQSCPINGSAPLTRVQFCPFAPTESVQVFFFSRKLYLLSIAYIVSGNHMIALGTEQKFKLCTDNS